MKLPCFLEHLEKLPCILKKLGQITLGLDKKSAKILKSTRTQSFVFFDLSIFFRTNFSFLKKVLISQPKIRVEKKLNCFQYQLVKIYKSKLCKIIVKKCFRSCFDFIICRSELDGFKCIKMFILMFSL